MTSTNAYISFRDARPPSAPVKIASGVSAAGLPFFLGVIPDEHYPALTLTYGTPAGGQATVRTGIERMVDSIIGARSAARDEWEPLRLAEENGDGHELWGNSSVSCSVQRSDGVVVIEYHRRDRAPIHDWRVGQRIKNELAGDEWEGVELYPAMSRLVDEANSYHLTCFDRQVAVGAAQRDVHTQNEVAALAGASPDESGPIQRDPDPDWLDAVKTERN